MSKIGFIGMGNMAGAIARGFIATGAVKPEAIVAYAPNQSKLKINSEAIGFVPCESAAEVVKASDIIIMACKPYHIEGVLREIRELLDGKVLISIALGWLYEEYAKQLDMNRVQVLATMPNMPLSAGEGVILLEETNNLIPEIYDDVRKLFAGCGMVEVVPSKLFGIAGTISGCGPAFMDMVLEAYGDAGVKYGLNREQAYRLVAQTMLGSAKLYLDTKKHPGELKDEVCSPGGSTIVGVTALEESGLKAACIHSIDSIMNRNK